VGGVSRVMNIDKVVEVQSTLMDTAGAVKRPRTSSDDEPHGTTSWSPSGWGQSGYLNIDEVVEAQFTLLDTAGAVKRPHTSSDDEPHGTTSWSRGSTSGRGQA